NLEAVSPEYLVCIILWFHPENNSKRHSLKKTSRVAGKINWPSSVAPSAPRRGTGRGGLNRRELGKGPSPSRSRQGPAARASREERSSLHPARPSRRRCR